MVVRRTYVDVETVSNRRLLRLLLRRSGYVTSDLEAADSLDRIRELNIIGHITKGTIMSGDYDWAKRQSASVQELALSRWEDEGGSASDPSRTTAPEAEAVDEEGQ